MVFLTLNYSPVMCIWVVNNLQSPDSDLSDFSFYQKDTILNKGDLIMDKPKINIFAHILSNINKKITNKYNK